MIPVALAALVGSLLATGAPASASYGPPGAPAANPAVAVPLSGSVTTAATTWATVLMGKNDSNFDLFWQLFTLNPKTGRFGLVTPPGVADNGGLVVATSSAGATALVGFNASQGLKFSPLALSDNRGKSWSPGGLPNALFTAPSAVGLASSGKALSLVGTTNQQVLTRDGGLTSWTTLTTKRALSATPAGQTCTIGTLEAVAFAPDATPLVGTSCRRPDTPGVFVDSDRQWHLADIPVPAALASAAFATVRLNTTSALFAAVQKTTTNLVAAWEPAPDRPWTLSPSLPIKSAKDLVASGTGPGGMQFVVVRSAGRLRAETIAGPDATWKALPTLPSHTATIAVSPNGQMNALSVDVTKLSIWTFNGTAKRWVQRQTITVPMVFGSSG